MQQVPVMVAAIVAAVLVMMLAAGQVSAFVENNPTIKMLALSFLVLIGFALFAEGLDIHVPKGYIYFAMAFSFGGRAAQHPRQQAQADQAAQGPARRFDRHPQDLGLLLRWLLHLSESAILRSYFGFGALVRHTPRNLEITPPPPPQEARPVRGATRMLPRFFAALAGVAIAALASLPAAAQVIEPASSVWQPRDVAVDAQNNLYITDIHGHRVLKVRGGVVTVIAGTGTAGYGRRWRLGHFGSAQRADRDRRGQQRQRLRRRPEQPTASAG